MAAQLDDDDDDDGWAPRTIPRKLTKALSDALAVLPETAPLVPRRDDYADDFLGFRRAHLRRSGGPVVLRLPELAAWRANGRWRRRDFLADPYLSDVAVRPSRAPYVPDPKPVETAEGLPPAWTTLGAYVADEFRGDAPTLRAACEAFAETGDARQACAAALRAPPPRVVFQRLTAALAPGLLADVSPPPPHFAAPTGHRPRAFVQQRSHVADAPPFAVDADPGARPLLREDDDCTMKQFALAPALSGSPPHIHGAAWNYLASGRKRWFLWEPRDSTVDAFAASLGGEEPLPFGTPVLKWFVAEYPRLAVRPHEVVQEAGDVVFVPAGWGHAVLNLEPSVAVAFELGFPSLNDDPDAPTHGYMVVDLPA